MNKKMIAMAASSALVVGLVTTETAQAHTRIARASLMTATGTEIGTVKFRSSASHTEVTVTLHTNGDATVDAFHGLHVHANADQAGCVADPAQAPSSWFTSVGGHWKADGQAHPNHLGDMPSVYLNADGSTQARFTIDRIAIDQLEGKAVVLHAGPDNFGNVPTATSADGYTANSPDAITKTQNTGNAGDRVACGVIAIR